MADLQRAPESPDAGSLSTGYALVGVVALFFGIAPSFAKLAFDGGTGPVTLQFGRFALAAVILWAIVLSRSLRATLGSGTHLRLGGLIATTAGASFGYMTSVQFISVPLASLIFFIFPLMVGPLSHLAGHERLTGLRVAALLIGFAGLALVLGPGLQSAHPIGLGLAFGAGTCVAISFLLTRRLSSEIRPLHLTALVTTGCTVVFAVGIAGHEGLQLPTNPVGWTGFLVNVACYVVGLSSLYAAIARLGSVRVAVVVNLEPVISVATAWLLLGQLLSPWQFVGGGIVITGILLMQAERLRAPTSK